MNAPETNQTTKRTTGGDGTTAASAAVTTMMLETQAIDGHERAVVQETVEVPYDANDLENRRREELVAMVERQPGKWPYSDSKRRFTSKTNMSRMRSVLLDHTHGFTKEVVVTRPLSPPPRPTGNLPAPRPDTAMQGSDDGGAELAGASPGVGGGRASPDVQPEDNQRTGDDGDDDAQECTEVDVYVTFISPDDQDLRSHKVYTVEVPRVGWADVLTHEWLADTQQLVEGLAAQDPAVTVADEISYPDPVYSKYCRRLKAVTDDEDIMTAPTDVPTVHIPASNVLKLTIPLRPMEAPSSGSAVHEPTDQPPRSAAMASEPVPVPLSLTVQWLREEVEAQEGFTAFKQGQHHIQTNPNIVASWQFAVSFSEHHSQMVSPVQAPSDHGHRRKRPKRIQKREVQQALGVGATWMSEATQAVALLRKYGEGGSSPRRHVIDLCSDRTDKIGARALLSRLREEDEG